MTIATRGAIENDCKNMQLLLQPATARKLKKIINNLFLEFLKFKFEPKINFAGVHTCSASQCSLRIELSFLNLIFDSYLRKLSITNTISVENYLLWLLPCFLEEKFQLFNCNVLQIFNNFHPRRLQTPLNVVHESLWVMTCRHLK